MKPSIHEHRMVRVAAAVVGVGYPALLAASALLLRYVGERWWPTAVLLYLPRFGFALPLPFVVGALLVLRARRLAALQVVSGLLLLFPLLGFVVSLPRSFDPEKPHLRVMTCNVDSAHEGLESVVEEIHSFSPGLVVLQETGADGEAFAARLGETYPNVSTSTQFLLASRHPVVEVVDPQRLPYFGRDRSPRFMQYVIDTPLGRIALFNVHPISPREGFLTLRQGIRHEILSGRIFHTKKAAELDRNDGLRELQVATIADRAEHQPLPAILAGDTNLPTLSHIFGEHFGVFQDGFASVGLGFGYTFPAHGRVSWLRLDRILASRDLRFVEVHIGRPDVSDHRCVVADVERR